jgi:mannose/fructose/N-acetylgalactosamine-specific phosphotransferase system component IIC
MWLSSIEVAILGGVLCLDRILLQVMISRPIVIGPVVGIFLGDPYTGLIVGAFIELLWINRFAIGAYIPPNDSIAAVLITAGSILAGRELGHLSRELVTLAILLFVPCAIIGQKMDIWVVKSNDRLSEKAVEDAEAGDIRGLSRKHIVRIISICFGNVAFIFIFLLLGITLLVRVFPLLPANLLKALTYTYYFLPILGVSVALNTIKVRGAVPVFSGLFLVFMLVAEIF